MQKAQIIIYQNDEVFLFHSFAENKITGEGKKKVWKTIMQRENSALKMFFLVSQYPLYQQLYLMRN